MTCGRELVGAVKARGSHVDRVGLPVMPVSERRAATLAEGPAYFIGRAVVGRLTVDEGEPSRGEGKPRDRLRARRSAARYAVADRRSKRFSSHPVSHPPAETPTLAGTTAHHFSLPFPVPANILAARRSLFAIPNLTERSANHGSGQRGTEPPAGELLVGYDFRHCLLMCVGAPSTIAVTVRGMGGVLLLWIIRLLYWPPKS
jgi:hypothetical protein